MDLALPPEVEFANKLIRFCLSLEDEIIEILDLNARWEIWLQIELARILRQNGYLVELEAKYDSNNQRLDLKVVEENQIYAVELKVESSIFEGKFAGRDQLIAGGDDIFKLQAEASWDNVPEKNKLCMMVAYSDSSLSLLRELSVDQPPSHFCEGDYIGIAVYHAFYY